MSVVQKYCLILIVFVCFLSYGCISDENTDGVVNNETVSENVSSENTTETTNNSTNSSMSITLERPPFLE
jgi:amino acid permease